MNRDELARADHEREVDRFGRVHVADDSTRFARCASRPLIANADLDPERFQREADVVRHDRVSGVVHLCPSPRT